MTETKTQTKTQNQTFKLESGFELPQVGFGLWKVPKHSTAEVVYNAIKCGYRNFDGAYDYQNEKEAGEGIRKAIADGLVTRDEIFVTTKLWNNYHSKEHALKLAKCQNESWGLDYIDLYLMHFPVALKYVDPQENQYPAWWTDEERTTVKTARIPIRETWEAMESLVDLGIARSIGVSNFQAQSIYDILSYNRIPISALQVEHHPYLVQAELFQLCKENNIAFIAYSSYGPQSFLELPGTFSELAKDITPLFQHKSVLSIASTHNKSPAQVLLRWATQRGVAVIPKASTQAHLEQNLHLDFDLSRDEINSISNLDIGLRFNDPGHYLKSHPLHIFA
ncbi:unnamed protein product [Debaryomyces fabryi]|nr:unnamed protein product [Debaryomyces fabryi]